MARLLKLFLDDSAVYAESFTDSEMAEPTCLSYNTAEEGILAEVSEHEHHSETDDQVGKTDPLPEIIPCLDTITSDEAQIRPKARFTI
jgi:hypothetical protein